MYCLKSAQERMTSRKPIARTLGALAWRLVDGVEWGKARFHEGGDRVVKNGPGNVRKRAK